MYFASEAVVVTVDERKSYEKARIKLRIVSADFDFS